MGRIVPLGLGWSGIVVWVANNLAAQDYSVLRINEVIAENDTQLPADVGGDFVDMVEIYNAGTEALAVGSSNRNASLALSNTLELPLDPPPWGFPSGTTVQPRKSILVFCDSEAALQGTCEFHAGFSLASDGSEPITLWGPVIGADAIGRPVRQVIDQVWLPPLRADVSFGRFPDGAGPAPVPLDQVLDTFRFHLPGDTTFGDCLQLPTPCAGGTAKKRFCRSAPNTPGGPLPPRLDISSYSTNQPAADEAVRLRVRVRSEHPPAPPAIERVEIVYRVDAEPEQSAALEYDAATGVEQGVIHDPDGNVLGPSPFEFQTYWDGAIPGQRAGARVTFHLRGIDAGGAVGIAPDHICPDDGPRCGPEQVAARCRDCRRCDRPYTFRVAFAPTEPVAGIVINEIVPRQQGLLMDRSQFPCASAAQDVGCAQPSLGQDPCCQEDFLEIYNHSSAAVDLTGYWLSDRPFTPERWRFPAGSVIEPKGYWIVWLDDDGGKCPDQLNVQACQAAECPDPSERQRGVFHANFAVDANGDDVYLFAPEADGFGVIHGLDFRSPLLLGSPADFVLVNHSLSYFRDGTRTGCWVISDAPTPFGPNDPGSATRCSQAFLRGDANDDCKVDLSDGIFTLAWLFQGGGGPSCPDAADATDSSLIDISDAIFTLNHLFLGGAPFPPPGSHTLGIDPTADDLPVCRTRCL